MIKKFLLVMESKTEELTMMMMKSKCETWTLSIHLRGAVQKTQLIAPPIQETYGETSFIEGADEHTPLFPKEERDKALAIKIDEENQDKAWAEIKRKFPKVDTTKFTATLDENDRVKVRLMRDNGKYHSLFKPDGEVNKKLGKIIIKALGPRAEDIVEANREEISRHEKKIDELKASRETASVNQREQIDANIEQQQNEISRLEAENEHY